MIEFGFVLGLAATLWALEHPEWFMRKSEPTLGLHEIVGPDWIHSVTHRYADPIDDLRAGYIDRYEYTARMSALKRFITPSDFLIGPAFANHERIVRHYLAE